jgi:hypothetical protein
MATKKRKIVITYGEDVERGADFNVHFSDEDQIAGVTAVKVLEDLQEDIQRAITIGKNSPVVSKVTTQREDD